MPGLRDLPMELLLCVCDALSEHDTCSLMRTCWFYYNNLQKYVYRRNIIFSQSTLLPYVVQAGNRYSIAMVLNLGGKLPLIYHTRNHRGQTALLEAIRADNVDLALQLINIGGPQLNLRNPSTGWRPLTLAVKRNQEKVVSVLIAKKGLKVGGKKDYHGVPLILAAQPGHYRLVEMLLEIQELDRGVEDRKMRTALDLAVLSGCWRTVQILLNDPFTSDPWGTYGGNAMLHAIASGNVKIVEILVQKKFPVTAFHLGKALQSGNEAISRALLSGGLKLAGTQ